MTPESPAEEDGVRKQSSLRKPGGGLIGVVTVPGETRSAMPLSRVKLMVHGRRAGSGDGGGSSDHDEAPVPAASRVVEMLVQDAH